MRIRAVCAAVKYQGAFLKLPEFHQCIYILQTFIYNFFYFFIFALSTFAPAGWLGESLGTGEGGGGVEWSIYSPRAKLAKKGFSINPLNP